MGGQDRNEKGVDIQGQRVRGGIGKTHSLHQCIIWIHMSISEIRNSIHPFSICEASISPFELKSQDILQEKHPNKPSYFLFLKNCRVRHDARGPPRPVARPLDSTMPVPPGENRPRTPGRARSMSRPRTPGRPRTPESAPPEPTRQPGNLSKKKGKNG